MDEKNLTGQIHNAMYQNIRKKGWVAPIDVFLAIGVLTEESHERWRYGKVPHLEKVCRANLRQLSGIMHEMRVYAAKNDLKPSWTYYHQWGKNKKMKLRFSKSGDEKIEVHYATHLIDQKRIEELKNPTLGTVE
jgi:hypothetical protein